MASKNTIARPYARAAFEVAFDHKALSHWSEMLEASSFMVQDKAFAALIKSPTFSYATALQWMLEIGGHSFSGEFQALLRLLAEKKRLLYLPEIANFYESYRREAESGLDALVVSAAPLSQNDCEHICKALERRWKVSHVRLKQEIDTQLLAGAIIKANDWVLDGSVRGKLQKLGEALGI